MFVALPVANNLIENWIFPHIAAELPVDLPGGLGGGTF